MNYKQGRADTKRLSRPYQGSRQHMQNAGRFADQRNLEDEHYSEEQNQNYPPTYGVHRERFPSHQYFGRPTMGAYNSGNTSQFQNYPRGGFHPNSSQQHKPYSRGPGGNEFQFRENQQNRFNLRRRAKNDKYNMHRINNNRAHSLSSINDCKLESESLSDTSEGNDFHQSETQSYHKEVFNNFSQHNKDLGIHSEEEIQLESRQKLFSGKKPNILNFRAQNDTSLPLNNDQAHNKFPSKVAPKSMVQIIQSMKDNYENILESVTPSDIIMEYRRKVDELSDSCTQSHQKRAEHISKEMQQQSDEKYKCLLEAHLKNLISQQDQFDNFIKEMKSQLMNLHCIPLEKIITEANDIFKTAEFESKLFKRSLPVYALKKIILDAVEANQVTIVVADCCYFLSFVLPHFFANNFSNVISCVPSDISRHNLESNCLHLIGHEKDSGKTRSSLQFLTEEQIICKDLNSIENACLVFDVSLKRTIEADVLLANVQDILRKKTNCKAILLVSAYDNISKYENYLSRSATVSLITAPTLMYPVKTVWKKASLSYNDDYVSDVVKTVVAIIANNESGDILVFLPSIQDGKTASANLNRRLTEYKMDAECTLLHEKCGEKNALNVWNKKNRKRSVILSTDCAEQLVFPSVRHVIDCGLQRSLQYDPKNNLEILTTTFISKSRAKLRKSFAGAFSSDGICYRLYNREDYNSEMNDVEYPEILIKSPFNSMVKLFQYRQNDAVTVDLIDPIPTKIKDNTIDLLNKYNAIKDGQLTVLGNDMVKLPFSARHSKLIVLGIQWGLRYETVILVAFFLVKGRVFQYSKDEEEQRVIDGIKLQVSQHDSDPLTYLYVYRKWKESKCSRAWCVDNCINLTTLQEVDANINEICTVVFEALKENVVHEFSDDKFCISSLQEIMFDCFRDNLCMFTGHYRSGYHLLTAQHIAYLHPSSIICQKEDLPQFVIFEHVLSTSRDFMIHVSSVPRYIITEALQKGIITFSDSELVGKKLVPTVIEPVGEMLIKSALLGKKGKKLKEIEETIKKETDSDLIVVEPSIEKGCVTLYTLPHCIPRAENIIRNILCKKMEDILKEEEVNSFELKKGKNKIVVDVNWMKGAKTLSVNCDSNSVINRPSKEIKLSQDSDALSVIQYSIHLQWSRRKCAGVGHLVYDSSDFQRARKHAFEYINIHGSEVCIQIDKLKPNQLYLTSLHPETTREEIELTMLLLIPGTKVKSVILKFEAPYETTTEDIVALREKIKEECIALKLSKFDVVIPKPKDSDTVMKAYVNINGDDEVGFFSESFNDVVIENATVTATPVYRCIIKCSVHVFNALQSRFQGELTSLENKYKKMKYFTADDLFSLSAEEENFDTACLKLLSNYSEVIKELRTTVMKLLEGDILDSSRVEGLHKLFCHGGHLWLQTLEKAVNVVLRDEYKSKVIRIYGSYHDCSKAKHRISQFLEDTENEAVKKIDLSRSGGNRRILLKAMLKKYGVNLEKYIEEYELLSAILDIRSCQLTLHGTVENIERAEEALQELLESQDCNIQDCLSSSREMCPVCACPAIQLTLRLEHCGHLYCFDCVKSLVEQAKFPIQCCSMDCNKDIVLEDIRKILDFNQEKIQGLLEKSARDYIERNRTDIAYCPAPDCSMFYFENQVAGPKWLCPLCQNEICIKCKAVYHQGFSCEMFQGSKSDPDYSFKVWQKTNAMCKRCPTCKTAIEKTAGCNHMTCKSCRGHFCWLCVKPFASGQLVHDHQPYCPENQRPFT